LPIKDASKICGFMTKHEASYNFTKTKLSLEGIIGKAGLAVSYTKSKHKYF
jgi:hypothetical protein